MRLVYAIFVSARMTSPRVHGTPKRCNKEGTRNDSWLFGANKNLGYRINEYLRLFNSPGMYGPEEILGIVSCATGSKLPAIWLTW